MPNYVRAKVGGATYFFTVNLLERRARLLIEHVDGLKNAVLDVKRLHPFRIDAWVVLPDHMHAVWTLPTDDDDFSLRWAGIKRRFSTALPQTEHRSPVRTRRGERGIWQRRFWEHLVRDEDDFHRHVDYCHINPVRHGCVDRVGEWPNSTFHRYVRMGLYPENWASDVDGIGGFGERG
jgi:putative transposase